MPPHLVADIPFMEVYGEVTRLDQLTYKCVADCEPQPWDSCDAASTEDGGSKKGADAASAGLIAGVVVGVAALAAIAFGAYWYMRSKGGAEPPMRSKGGAEPPMVEVQEMASAPVPVASAAPTMPPLPPTGQKFCGDCGARLEGPFCGKCGARAQ